MVDPGALSHRDHQDGFSWCSLGKESLVICCPTPVVWAYAAGCNRLIADGAPSPFHAPIAAYTITILVSVNPPHRDRIRFPASQVQTECPIEFDLVDLR